MPHYTYVTRPRTIRPPPPPTTSPTTPITSSKWTTTTTPSTTPHRYDDDDDDAYPDNGLIHTKPEVIDPVPTLWPTSNWWGSIDPLRNNHKNNRNSRLDSTSSSSSSSSNSGSGISRSNSNAYYPAIRSGSSRVHPSPTSSSSSSPPYFQLLLAGLLQVRLPSTTLTSLLLLLLLLLLPARIMGMLTMTAASCLFSVYSVLGCCSFFAWTSIRINSVRK